MLDPVFRTSANYYCPRVFLEECKCGLKEKKIVNYIIDDIEISSDSDREKSDQENSDREYSDRENSDEKTLIKNVKKNSYNPHFKAYF